MLRGKIKKKQKEDFMSDFYLIAVAKKMKILFFFNSNLQFFLKAISKQTKRSKKYFNFYQ
jgi:hypothetical protein